MIELVHEITHLVFQRSYFSVTFGKLLLFALQIESLLIDQSVELLNLIQSLANFEFKVSDVAAQIITLVCLNLICNVQSIDFFQVFAVSFSQCCQFVICLTFLGLQAGVRVLTDLVLVFHTLDVYVSIADQSTLPIELSVKLSVLSLSIVIDLALLVNLRSKSLDESNVSIDT